MRALAKVGIVALVDEATGYEKCANVRVATSGCSRICRKSRSALG